MFFYFSFFCQVILQLWMICSYFCDGFGTFANMYGSKFIGQAKYHKFHRLSRRMAGFAITIGIAACFLILTFKSQIMNIFIHQDDVETRRYLNQAWLLVGIVQPINAMVFVYDGLLFAANSFAFARNVLISGFFMFVGPMLFYAKEQDQTGLFLIWASNGALSFWRMGASLYHVHVSLPEKQKIDALRIQSSNLILHDTDANQESFGINKQFCGVSDDNKYLLPNSDISDSDKYQTLV
eukprot:TRINITY_DN676758_c0_g1_i1.p1 TRINITY_DN676758_c0_g1~~TRINITY_DN676758_c0_g1_i1.p1  ORF type:complete len:238 (-),score=54.34 TRINITY_DN676758_c0_g1_i1:139-852(-)